MPTTTLALRAVVHVEVVTTVRGAGTTVTVDGDGWASTTTRGGGAGGGVIATGASLSSVGITTQRLPPLPIEMSVFHGFLPGASAITVWLPGSTTIALPHSAESTTSPSRLITRPSVRLFDPTCTVMLARSFSSARARRRASRSRLASLPSRLAIASALRNAAHELAS